MSSEPKLVLASTSPYRRRLMERLGIAFRTTAPDCDETQFDEAGMSVAELTARLAEAKAEGVASSLSEAGICVIGCDQLVEWDGRPLGKPGSRQKAIEQLEKLSTNPHFLHTSTCLHFGGTKETWTDTVAIRLYPISRQGLEAYVDQDKPWDCAGSYRFESLGIGLIESIDATDPTAIEGMPLLELHRRLRRLGFRAFER